MANIKEMLEVSGGSFSTAETFALKQVSDGRPQFWLDLALLLSVQGKFSGARQAQSKYLESFPVCPRVRFGMAPFALADGELQAGLQLLEYGRDINCWGNKGFKNITAPVWDGADNLAGKTLLIHCEGGIGDQVMAMRAVFWAEERGANSIIACDKNLVSIAARIAAAVDSELSHGVYYDFWIPGMSAPRLFQRTWNNLYPGQYIRRDDSLDRVWRRTISKKDGGLNIGLRWQGNPQFEHEQLRRFDTELLFDATRHDRIDRWSIQKEASTVLPNDVVDLERFLTSWEHTIAVMSQLDLVVTSCTSIAHIAGAMNMPTWVIVPVMPYYPWVKPGKNTDWYPSIKLYRQEKYGDWTEPFEKIKSDLRELAQC